MSSSYAEPFARLEACLDEIGSVDPVYRTTAEKQEALVGLSRVIARAQAEQQRVLAVADDIAEATGARSTAAWLAHTTHDAPGRLREEKRLADALESRWLRLQEVFRAGTVNLAQVRVIDTALTDLPPGLDASLVAKAEEVLVAEAADHGPRDLAILGSRILERLAPEVAEQAEYAALLAAEDSASATTRLSLRRRGDGSTDVHARIPDHAAGRLRTYLDAFTAPRRDKRRGTGQEEFANLPAERRQGIGFVALLERVLAKDLPQHGGKATTVGVLIPHAQLVADLEQAGVASTTTGDRMTVGQARRLACNAGLLPAVLGTNSEVLDLGRESRLFKAHQRKGMEIRDKTCTEFDCTMPAAFCEAHHKKPWSKGGATDLDDGTLLCPFHHHRAHDPRWETRYHPNGSTTFHRRQ